MSRFIQCGCGRLVNVDSIARVEAGYKKHDDCTIITKDGEYIRYIVEMFSGKMVVNRGCTMLNILLYVQTEKLGPWNA